MSLQNYNRDWLRTEARNLVFSQFAANWTLPPRLTVSEWADNFRRLSPESSAEVGPWDTARAEYQRGMMDAVSDIEVTRITFMTSSQVGKTELINNTVGYIIDQDPGPIMLVQHTLDLADAWSEDRLTPMLRDTTCLEGKVSDPKSRSAENKKRHKVFHGGHITMAGANSASSLASRPIRFLLADEIDRYPYSAGVEGDPVKLAEKRTTTFWNRKIIVASTPTVKGASRIEKSFEESDQRYFHVPCPHCGQFQVLYFKNVKWEKDDPASAYYECEECTGRWSDVERITSINKGHWVATKEFRGHAGFWLWEAYSPWVKLSEMVKNFLEAKRHGPEMLKVFVNTSLAESWEDSGERVDETILMARREDYGDMAPDGVVVITAGVDVQGDRLEVELVGWGLNNQSWGLGKTVLHGDPTGNKVWDALDDILMAPVKHETMGLMEIMATCIDSGYLSQHVGLFCRPRWGRRIYAVKGLHGPGNPIWKHRPSKYKKTNLNFFLVGVDQAKETIYSNLRVTEPDAGGYCHFNTSYDGEHFDQLTSEEVTTTYSKGRPARKWGLKKGKKRNEALDIRVYALAALECLRFQRFSIREQYKKNLIHGGASMEQARDKLEAEAGTAEITEPKKNAGYLVGQQPRKRRTFKTI